MSLLLDAYNLLIAPGNPMNFDDNLVFLYFIPENLPDGSKSEDAPVLVKITNIQNGRGNFASNRSNSLSATVQVQIWYNYDDELADQYDEVLNDYMEFNGFYPMDTSYVSKDPDVEKLFLTTKFRKTQYS
jgi:hypothetical protein